MQKTINFSIALLLGLLIASAPRGGSAFAQNSNEYFGGPRSLTNILLTMFGASRLSSAEDDQLYIGVGIIGMYDHAVHGLREGDEPEFHRNRAALLATLRKDGVSAPNKKMVKRLLATLPNRYVKGFAFLRDDGTVAQDPDKFIEDSLSRAENAILGSGDSGGGAD